MEFLLLVLIGIGATAILSLTVNPLFLGAFMVIACARWLYVSHFKKDNQ